MYNSYKLRNKKLLIFHSVLTVHLSTCIVGRAEGYNKNIRFVPTPIKIPYSTPIIKQNKKVANIGIKSFLLVFHMSFTT